MGPQGHDSASAASSPDLDVRRSSRPSSRQETRGALAQGGKRVNPGLTLLPQMLPAGPEQAARAVVTSVRVPMGTAAVLAPAPPPEPAHRPVTPAAPANAPHQQFLLSKPPPASQRARSRPGTAPGSPRRAALRPGTGVLQLPSPPAPNPATVTDRASTHDIPTGPLASPEHSRHPPGPWDDPAFFLLSIVVDYKGVCMRLLRAVAAGDGHLNTCKSRPHPQAT